MYRLDRQVTASNPFRSVGTSEEYLTSDKKGTLMCGVFFPQRLKLLMFQAKVRPVILSEVMYNMCMIMAAQLIKGNSPPA